MAKCAGNKTGLVFDDRMTEHHCLWDSGHIERPERYIRSLQKFKEYDLINRCQVLPSRYAEQKELLLVHTEKYINEVKHSSHIDDPDELEKLSSKYDSVYFNKKTYDCALLAAGCTLNLVSSILEGTVNNGLALVRPPGHHAMVQAACGFCFFNNVAIAAKHALEKFNLKKILIVDWDVHHGQGTQQIFYDDPRVLYFSIHRFENGDFWPNLRESHLNYIGGDSAQGFNINVPLNCNGLENGDYLAIFNNILLPIAYEFNPELVLISSGYDAAIGCPEGEMRITPYAYPHFLNSLSCLAGGRMCVILEGGYCLSSLSESVAMTLRSLLGDPCPSIPQCIEMNEELKEVILSVISIQRPFWDSIKLQDVYDNEFDDDSDSKHRVKICYTRNPREFETVFKTRGDYPVQSSDLIKAVEAEITDIISSTDLSVPVYHTGFAYDSNSGYSECTFAKHIDASTDLMALYQKLLKSRLVSKCVSVCGGLETEAPREEDMHFKGVVRRDLKLSQEALFGLDRELRPDQICQGSDFYFNNVLRLIDAVASGVCVNGYGIIHPPHIKDASSSGFSTICSLTIAAKYLATEYKMNKILIVDLDVHGSNSFQRKFYDDDKVLCISLHYHDEHLSGSSQNKIEEIGENQGKGYNINIPFKHTAMDGDYLSALFHVMLPVIYEFGPEFVLVNLGLTDYSINTRLTASCFGVIAKLLSNFCSGKMVMVSDSNFKSETAPDTVAHCISALLGEWSVPLRSAKPTPEGITTIQNVVKVHKKYWKCLAFDVKVPDKIQTPGNDTALKRRQSSDPVAIPQPQNTGVTIELGFDKGEMYPDEFFCVTPLENCPHLELLQPIPSEGLNPRAACVECKDLNENWVCLHCYQVYCGRFINQHMLQHGMDMNHYLTLSYSDLSVWCYACDSYIHNNMLQAIKDHACDRKFGSS